MRSDCGRRYLLISYEISSSVSLKFNVPMQVRNYKKEMSDAWITYGCFSDYALSEFVKVSEKFHDAYSVFQYIGLKSFFNIQLHV